MKRIKKLQLQNNNNDYGEDIARQCLFILSVLNYLSYDCLNQLYDARYITEGKGMEDTDFYYNNKSIREIISDRSGLDVKFYSYLGDSCCIRWNSDGKAIDVNVIKNKEIVIE